jgi:hypothetical protein
MSGILAVGFAFVISNANYFGKDVFVSLATSYAVSVIFYLMIVWVPTRSRKARIKRSAIAHYKEFKIEVMGLLLHAAKEGWTSEDRERLVDPGAFTEYFTADETGSGMRWYEVLNGLDDYYVSEIALRLDMLRSEIQFVLDSIEIEDEELFLFMKRLSRISQIMSKKSSDYDDVKTWGRFLWGIYANWDAVVGHLNGDQNLKMFERL